MTILVTGSAGFIGANFVLDWLASLDEAIVSLDKLTYAGNRANLRSLEQIEIIKDRPGHDRRCAINASTIRRELGWTPAEAFESGIRKTVSWYLDNQEWVAANTSGAYREWASRQYQ